MQRNPTPAPQTPPKRRLRVRIARGFLKVLGVLTALSILLVLLFRWMPLPGSSVMAQYWIKSTWIGDKVTLRYTWIPFERIAPNAALAVIAAEDQRFPNHHGFDWVEINHVWADLWAGKRLRGASTISQQVAKNLFLWQDRNLIRKGLEAWFTVLIEWLWTKERILEVYLNIVDFGRNTFGVEAASQRFFNKAAIQLNASEAARLAAVLPNPVRYRVDKPSSRVLKRQRWIQRQMRQLGGTAYLNRL